MRFNYLFIFPLHCFALWDSKACHRPSWETVSWHLETCLFLKTPFLGQISVPTSFVSLFIFYILSYLLSKTTGCFSGCLMSSASIQNLFCGICSAFKCSFDEFVGEKVVSPSYSSAMLGLPPLSSFLMNLFSYAVCWLLRSLIYCEMKCLSLRHVRPFVTPWDSPGNTRVDCHFLLQICFQGICKYKLIFINMCVKIFCSFPNVDTYKKYAKSMVDLILPEDHLN